MDDPDKTPLKIANDSGFPLQIAVEHMVRTSPDLRGRWSALYTEHSWSSRADGDSGFIDLVLKDGHDSTFLIVECKRVRDSAWVFMHSTGKCAMRTHAKAWISQHGPSPGMRRIGWYDTQPDPATPEAIFCSVRGQSQPMIERVGGELVTATEAFAVEQRDVRPTGDSIRFYFPVIVTTAVLHVVEFDPANVSLSDGTIGPGAATKVVPFLRFRKQLSDRQETPDPAAFKTASEFAYAKEHTLFVVNAEAMLDFLLTFEVPDDAVRALKFN